MAEDMENLGDILKRLRENQSANGDASDRDIETIPPDEPGEDVCAICEGRLWLAIDAPVGHPDFGKAEPCQCQAEIDLSERAGRLRRYANLGPLSRLTFGSANPEGMSGDPESKRLFGIAYETALAFAEQPSGWLVLTGPHGSGKTHLAASISNHCIEQGCPVFFVHVPDLLDDLRSTYSPMSDLSYSDLFEQVNDAPLLVLDGLGSQSPTPWAQEKLQQIFNRRANSELPTVVTTAAQIGDIDPYIASRMSNPRLGRVLRLGERGHEQAGRLMGVRGATIDQMTFDSFDTRGRGASAQQRASLEGAFRNARNFAANPEGWLTMFGETGVGKTHLAASIYSERRKRGDAVMFVSVPNLLDFLRQMFEPNTPATYDRLDEVRNSPLLILDELEGQDYYTAWAYEKLQQIIVHRHNMRMPTVVTSRNDFTEQRGPISSRIQDQGLSTLIRMDAPDYRRGQRQDSRRGKPEWEPRRSSRR